jgi:hypothetical protein
VEQFSNCVETRALKTPEIRLSTRNIPLRKISKRDEFLPFLEGHFHHHPQACGIAVAATGRAPNRDK